MGLYSYFILLGVWAWTRTGDASSFLGAAIILLVISGVWAGYALVRRFLLLVALGHGPSPPRQG